MKFSLNLSLNLVLFSSVGLGASSGNVIDLGVLRVQGKLRGPEIQLIESNQVGKDTADRMSRWELKKLEEELLKPSPPKHIELREGKS